MYQVSIIHYPQRLNQKRGWYTKGTLHTLKHGDLKFSIKILKRASLFSTECVLRLPGDDVGDSESVSSVQSSGSGRSVERRKARASKKEGEAPPGNLFYFIFIRYVLAC